MKIIRELAKEIVYEVRRLEMLNYVEETKKEVKRKVKETLDGIEEKSRYNKANRVNEREFKEEIKKQEKLLKEKAADFETTIETIADSVGMDDGDYSVESHLGYSRTNGFPHMDIRLKVADTSVTVRLTAIDETHVKACMNAVI